MPTGNYNVSRLLAELGHKNQIEMPVSKTIQVTMPLDSMVGQVPVHVAGMTVAGGWVGAQAGEYPTIELQALDPGGAVLMFTQQNTATDVSWQVVPGPTTWLTGPGVMTNLDFTNSPSVSVVRNGTSAAVVNTFLPRFQKGWFNFGGFAPLLIPRGQTLRIVGNTANVSTYYVIGFCGIAATENGE